jgi:hypothetical protein
MLIVYLKMVHIFKYVFYVTHFRIFEEFSEFEYLSIMAANWIMGVRFLAWIGWLFYSAGTPSPNEDYRHYLSPWFQNAC